MKPIDFPESNKCLSRPVGTTAEECSSLPIIQVDDFCISLWKGSWWDRLRFLFTGKVWLSIWSGATQPPVKVCIDQPFKEIPGHAGEVIPE